MKMTVWRSLMVMTAAAMLASIAFAGELMPAGWVGRGEEYDVGVDRNVAKEGKAAAYIKSKTAAQSAQTFGTIMQVVSAAKYAGKRVLLSAVVKAEKIEGWAGLWMRIDGQGEDEYGLSFDNMENKPIRGTSDWQRYNIVLDVPEKGRTITFGLLLAGTGKAWVDDFNFEVATSDTPVTAQPRQTPPKEPINLGFE